MVFLRQLFWNRAQASTHFIFAHASHHDNLYIHCCRVCPSEQRYRSPPLLLITTQGIFLDLCARTSQVDTATGEIAGVFETVQPTDDDMGAKPAKEAMVTGEWV